MQACKRAILLSIINNIPNLIEFISLGYGYSLIYGNYNSFILELCFSDLLILNAIA